MVRSVTWCLLGRIMGWLALSWIEVLSRHPSTLMTPLTIAGLSFQRGLTYPTKLKLFLWVTKVVDGVLGEILARTANSLEKAYLSTTLTTSLFAVTISSTVRFPLSHSRDRWRKEFLNWSNHVTETSEACKGRNDVVRGAGDCLELARTQQSSPDMANLLLARHSLNSASYIILSWNDNIYWLPLMKLTCAFCGAEKVLWHPINIQPRGLKPWMVGLIFHVSHCRPNAPLTCHFH